MNSINNDINSLAVFERLNKFENNIDNRISNLNDIVDHYQKTLHILKRYQFERFNINSKEVNEQCDEDIFKETNSLPNDNEDKVDLKSPNDLDKLDEILSIARSIRSSSITSSNNQKLETNKKTAIVADSKDVSSSIINHNKTYNNIDNSKMKVKSMKSSITKSLKNNSSKISSLDDNVKIKDNKLSIIEEKQNIKLITNTISNQLNIAEMKENSKSKSFIDDITAQLILIGKYRNPIYLSHIYMNKKLYIEKTMLLKKLTNHSFQPKSILYSLINKNNHQKKSMNEDINNTDIKPIEMNHMNHDYLLNNNPILIKLINNFKSLLINYERYMKIRINHDSFHVTSLSSEDRYTLIAMWYKGRKLIELYEYYMKLKYERIMKCICEKCKSKYCSYKATNNNNNNTNNNHDISNNKDIALEKQISLFAPILIPSQSITNIQQTYIKESNNTKNNHHLSNHQKKWNNSSNILQDPAKSWYKDSKNRVDTFHNTYQHRIKYEIESMIGKTYLKQTIQSLRMCSELQLSHNSSSNINNHNIDNSLASSLNDNKLDKNSNDNILQMNDDELKQKWILSWKLYRSVYSILINESKNTNECMFINK